MYWHKIEDTPGRRLWYAHPSDTSTTIVLWEPGVITSSVVHGRLWTDAEVRAYLADETEDERTDGRTSETTLNTTWDAAISTEQDYACPEDPDDRCPLCETSKRHRARRALIEALETKIEALGQDTDVDTEIAALSDLLARAEAAQAPLRMVALTPEAWQVVLSALEIISPDDDEHAQIAIETMAEIRRSL